MEIVSLKPLFHNNEPCIGIYSIQNATFNYYFEKKGGAKWSRTNKCWYIPCVEEKYEKLCKALHGKAIIQTEELKAYLKERKKNSAAKNMHLPLTAIPVVKPSSQKIAPQNLNQPHTINKENKEALQMFTQQLVLKSYSPSTIKTYRNEFIQFYRQYVIHLRIN